MHIVTIVSECIGYEGSALVSVSDLATGAGGTLTLTAVVSTSLISDQTLTNRAAIRALGEITTSNNSASVVNSVQLPRVYFFSASFGKDRDGGPVTIPITVTPDRVNPFAPVQVLYSSSDGTATTADNDYTRSTTP